MCSPGLELTLGRFLQTLSREGNKKRQIFSPIDNQRGHTTCVGEAIGDFQVADSPVGAREIFPKTTCEPK
jgi:hypothetical protein